MRSLSRAGTREKLGTFADLGLCVTKGPDPMDWRHCRATDFHVTIRQCAAPGGNFACAVLIRHETPSGGEVKVCLLP